tara:strand:+ start:75 stop:1562 length:1488 start_codon:yes stop_codon:yes gene_type:complete
MVNGEEGEENSTPPIHYVMLDELDVKQKHVSIANMIHRGAAKTTVFGEYLFLYLAVYGELPKFGPIDLAIYISDSMENGVKNMRKNLEFRYEESEFLQAMIPEAKFTDNRWEFKNVDGKRLIVKGYGAKTGVRGTKELGKRPQLAVIDDVISDEDADSDTVIKKVEDTISKAIEYAVHPDKNIIIWSGTPFNARDPLYKAVESGAWQVNVYPVCEKFPCTREEFRGSWEDRFDYDYVMGKYLKAKKQGQLESFYQELMLRIMSDDEKLLEDSDYGEYKLSQLKHQLDNLNIYITTDFGVSDTSRADLSAITVWAVNHNRQVFWIDGIARSQEMDKNIDNLFELCQKYNPLSVGIEISGQQKGFVKWVMSEMLRRNIYFNLASNNNDGKPGIMPVNNKAKYTRFKEIVPWFKQKLFYFPTDKASHPALIEMLEELNLATKAKAKSKYDDCLDTITQLMFMDLVYPSPAAVFSEGRSIYSSYGYEAETETGYDSYTG